MTTLIRNATIVSDGREPYRADVLLSGSNISAIGQLERQRADIMLDAGEGYLSPGIIDVASTEDMSSGLLEPERQAEFLTAGITTVVCGMRGYSLVALNNADRKYMAEMAGPWRMRGRGTAVWHTFHEFARHFERHPIGVNPATFIGVTPRTLKLCSSRKNREGEMLLRQLGANVQGGALGISIDASLVEPEALRSFLHSWNGLFPNRSCSIAIHLPIDFEWAQETYSSISQEIKKSPNKFIWSGYPSGAEDATAQSKVFGRYVRGFAGSRVEPLRAFFPRGITLDSESDVRAALSDSWFEKRMRTAAAELVPEKFRVRSAPHNPVFLWRTLKEIGEMYELRDAASIFWQLLRSTLGKAVLEFREEELPAEAYSSSLNLFGSLGGESLPDFLSFSERVSRLGAELPAGVAALTARPAEALGLKDCGQIAPSLPADLVLWNENGVRDVFVGGVLAVRDGKYMGARTGRPIAVHNK